MAPKFEYKNVHFFLLSFFGIIFIASLFYEVKIIPQATLVSFSIIAIVFSLISWLIDMYFVYKANKIRFRNAYITSEDKEKGDKYAGQYRLINSICLVAFLIYMLLLMRFA